MTDNRDKLARQWATKAMDATVSNKEVQAASEFILAHTEPEPETMAEVEWTTEYIFAGASDNHGTEVVMLDMWREEDGEPELYVTDPVDGGVVMEYPGHYTPNGKRYQITEVPDHPTSLSTVEDFENAPGGTIVAFDGYLTVPFVKRGDHWCRPEDDNPYNADAMATSSMPVLRWGWGESVD